MLANTTMTLRDVEISRTRPWAFDILIVNKDFKAESADSVTLSRGDIVEVLKTSHEETKKSVTETDSTTKYLVRVFGSDSLKEGWVPKDILETSDFSTVLDGNDKEGAELQKKAVIRELIETEEEFSKDLQNVVDRYIKAVDAATAPRTVRDSKDVIFGNFQQIAEFHNILFLRFMLSTKTTVKSVTETDSTTKYLVRVFGSDSLKEGWVPKDILETSDFSTVLDGNDKEGAELQKKAVIRELIETEEEFSKDLQNVVDRYIKAVDAATAPRTVRDSKDVIFGNFQQIAEFHNMVFIDGVKYYADKPSMVVKTFLRLERDFDMHVKYCKTEPVAQEYLSSNKEANTFFQI
uniref:DH domain-containing protein n=1 Tax=Glossina brevipalpis TaxID=37001 RepID=A0A1A9WI64_9MUSC